MSLACTGMAAPSRVVSRGPVVSRTFVATGDLGARCASLAEQADAFDVAGPGARWLSSAARSLAEVAQPWELPNRKGQVGVPGDERSYRLLVRSDAVEAWLIHWPSGGRLHLHDHGGASGALRVVSGELHETYIDAHCQLAARSLATGPGIAFGPAYIHDVANTAEDGATSVHVYAPPADTMAFYRYGGPGQVVRVGEGPFEEDDALEAAMAR
jgi:hypothetical protein